jgi:hypothetical protein
MTREMILPWLFLVLMFLLGAHLSVMNYRVLYQVYVRKEHHSPLPLIGGFLCLAAMLMCPIARIRAWAWVPLIVDPGGVFLVGVFIYTAIVTKGFKAVPPK